MEPPFQFLVNFIGIKLTFTLVSEMYLCFDGIEKNVLTQLSEVIDFIGYLDEVTIS